MATRISPLAIYIVLLLFRVTGSEIDLDEREPYRILPFLTLYEEPRTLHMVLDEFVLVQTIDLGVIVTHIRDVTLNFHEVRDHFGSFNDTSIERYKHLEQKLEAQVEHSAHGIEAELSLLPHEPKCLNRNKRSIQLDSQPVVKTGLFPQLGTLFSWFTGNLGPDAADVVNMNYNNIKRLTQISVGYAQMFNASLAVEHKHRDQIKSLKSQVDQLKTEMSNRYNTLDRENAYQSFLQDLTVVVMDMGNTVDNIFDHLDAVERNQLGPLARDRLFLGAIADLMNLGTAKKKKDLLYLMRISAKVDVKACASVIQITYRFPVLQDTDYTPWRTVQVPKRVKGKALVLTHMPFLITWREQVFEFTETEYRDCTIKNKHLFCRTPAKVQDLLGNCIYGLVENIPWSTLNNSCELTKVDNPRSHIQFTRSHVIFSNMQKDLLTVLCPELHPNRGAKTMFLEGSGVLTVPEGCKVKFRGSKTFTMGHLGHKSTVEFKIEDSIWKMNMSHVAPFLKVNNVGDNSPLWDDSREEEEVIEKGLEQTWNTLQRMEFSPNTTTITLVVVVGWTMVLTVLLVIALVCACNPLYARKFICCGCCRQPETVSVKAPV